VTARRIRGEDEGEREWGGQWGKGVDRRER
jgi:hypothetical protein